MPKTAKKPRILVVDDTPLIGRVLKRALGREYEVVSTTRGRECIELVESDSRFDLIFCDLFMPEVTGMDLYHHLLTTVPEQAKSIVFMSGGTYTEEAQAFRKSVSNPFLEKPFNVAELKTLIQSLM